MLQVTIDVELQSIARVDPDGVLDFIRIHDRFLISVRGAEIIEKDEVSFLPELFGVDHLLNGNEFKDTNIQTYLFLNFTDEGVLACFTEFNMAPGNSIETRPLVRITK